MIKLAGVKVAGAGVKVAGTGVIVSDRVSPSHPIISLNITYGQVSMIASSLPFCPRFQHSMSGSTPVFFWREMEQPYGFLSQWFHAPFTAPGFEIDSLPIYFKCTEQYMMYHKAILFQDHKTAHQILEAVTPATQKSLGRTVQGFDKITWDNLKEKIVEEGNWYKFSFEENFGLKKLLLETGEREFVEVEDI